MLDPREIDAILHAVEELRRPDEATCYLEGLGSNRDVAIAVVRWLVAAALEVGIRTSANECGQSHELLLRVAGISADSCHLHAEKVREYFLKLRAIVCLADNSSDVRHTVNVPEAFRVPEFWAAFRSFSREEQQKISDALSQS